MRARIAITATLLLVFGALAQTAAAKSARCYTTDEGEYDCDFVVIESDGSFRISAPGRPTFTLVMDGPGSGYGIDDFGEGGVNLPGVFVRSRSDPACWVNDVTDVWVCAW